MGKTTWSNFKTYLTKTAQYIDDNNIKYHNSFKGSLTGIKKFGVNCTAYVSISMKRAGLTKKAYNFYCKNGKLCGSETKQFSKKNGFSVKQNINKTLAACVKDGTVKVGDIVGAQKGAHTMVYKGKSNGKYVFYSVGKNCLTKKKITSNVRSGNYKVGVRIRPPYIKATTTATTTTASTVAVQTATTATKIAAKKYKVALYIGHGNSQDGSWDCGCTYTKGGKTYTEAELMKPIVGAAVKYLKASGITVYTDYPDNTINMVKQVAQANSKGVDLFVSVHCDYYKAVTGTLPLYISAKGKKLATAMNKYVMKETGIATRGLGYRSDLYELTATDAPACIFECGSIKNDLTKFQKSYDAFGKGIAEGICAYLGVTFKSA